MTDKAMTEEGMDLLVNRVKNTTAASRLSHSEVAELFRTLEANGCTLVPPVQPGTEETEEQEK